MKNLFFFALVAVLFVGCSESQSESSDIYLYLSQNELHFNVKGGTQTIEVEVSLNGDFAVDTFWRLSGGESWCTPSKTSGGHYEYITFTVAENDTSDERKASFIFSYGDATQTLIVTQSGDPTVIHVSQKGSLESVLKQTGISINDIVYLKIIGVLNDIDFLTIQTIRNLIYLDLSDVDIATLPSRAFYKSNITNLILPNSLTEIGDSTFANSQLESMVIPKTVSTIGSSAFYGCSKLATVTFEKGSQLKTIRGGYSGYSSYGTFSNCYALTSIEIPASVETIEAAAFYGCSSLATVTFEKGSQLKTIGSTAFETCPITSIEIPASVETIEDAAFKGCSSLATVTFEKGSQLKTIGGRYEYANYRVYYDGAFCELRNLQTVDMSACTQVEYIKDGAFGNDSNLQLFKIGTTTPPKCGEHAFAGINPYSVLKVPSGCADAYKEASEWWRFASITGLDE